MPNKIKTDMWARSQHLAQKQILKPVFLYLLYVTEDTYERTLTVDGEETTLIVMDNWENDKLVQCVSVLMSI